MYPIIGERSNVSLERRLDESGVSRIMLSLRRNNQRLLHLEYISSRQSRRREQRALNLSRFYGGGDFGLSSESTRRSEGEEDDLVGEVEVLVRFVLDEEARTELLNEDVANVAAEIRCRNRVVCDEPFGLDYVVRGGVDGRRLDPGELVSLGGSGSQN